MSLYDRIFKNEVEEDAEEIGEMSSPQLMDPPPRMSRYTKLKLRRNSELADKEGKFDKLPKSKDHKEGQSVSKLRKIAPKKDEEQFEVDVAKDSMGKGSAMSDAANRGDSDNYFAWSQKRKPANKKVNVGAGWDRHAVKVGDDENHGKVSIKEQNSAKVMEITEHLEQLKKSIGL